MSETTLTVVEYVEINPPSAPAGLSAPAAEPAPPPEPARKPFLCRHIFVDGHQCGSRALRGQHFCYYHYAHRTPVLAHDRKRHKGSGFDLSRLDGLDNHTAVQLSLSEVLGRIAANTIDPKRAWLLLYGLQIAGNNLRHSRPNAEADVPEVIVEEVGLGQLAEVEEGRSVPETEYMRLLTSFRREFPVQEPPASLAETSSPDLSPVYPDFDPER